MDGVRDGEGLIVLGNGEKAKLKYKKGELITEWLY